MVLLHVNSRLVMRFLRLMALIGLDKHNIHESEHFHVLASRLPLLNDCVVTKQTFLHRCSNSVVLFLLLALAVANCRNVRGLGRVSYID